MKKIIQKYAKFFIALTTLVVGILAILFFVAKPALTLLNASSDLQVLTGVFLLGMCILIILAIFISIKPFLKAI